MARLIEFLRNSAIQTRNYFDPPSTPPFRRNQFGGSIGGPIKKDKAFFFVNYEGLRQFLSQSDVIAVPDAAAHQGYLPNSAGVETPANASGKRRPPVPVFLHGRIYTDFELHPGQHRSHAGAVSGGGRNFHRRRRDHHRNCRPTCERELSADAF